MYLYRSALSLTGLLWLLSFGSIAQASNLNISSAVVNPGGTATLGVALTASGTAPAGLEWTIAYSPAQISGISITTGPAAAAAAKTLSCASGAGVATCLVVGMNANPVGSGVLAYLNTTLATGVTTASIQISSPVEADVNGNAVTITSTPGGVILVPSLSPVICSPTALNPGAVSTCTVTLTQSAPAGGSTVGLASNNSLLTVPASVTVPAGATTATFRATAGSTIATGQSGVVTATFGSSSQTATVNLVAASLVSGVTCSPSSLGQSAVSTCTVTLTQAAPAGGSSVTLSSNNTSLTLSSPVTVVAGATSASFTATAAATIASNQNATVTATLASSSKTATINLMAPVLVSGVVCSPTSLGQSALSTCTVTLTQAAPTGGSSVALSSNNTSLAVPSAVTLAAGATSASFGATAAATIASNQRATVTAPLGSS